MLAKDHTVPPPKAVNIIRPSSPLLQQFKRFPSPQHHLESAAPYISSQSSSTASSSSPSTVSSWSSVSFSGSHPAILGPANFASGGFSMYTPFRKAASLVSAPIAVQHRLLQRARSNSNLSKSTVFSMSSDEEDEADENDIDSIDGNSDKEDNGIEEDDDDGESDTMAYSPRDLDEDVSPVKIVARIKHGTIMNGKGEFVSKGVSVDDHAAWLDEARANRKIADLEIEKSSLLAVNQTLEATVRQQALRIEFLEKQLKTDDGPPTPVSDKAMGILLPPETWTEDDMENDQAFQRLRTMLQGLIEQAEAALLQKTKLSGKVLTDYQMDDTPKMKTKQDDEVLMRKLAARRSWSPTNTAIVNRQNQRPLRRVSDGQDRGRPQSPSRTLMQHTKTSMARSLSRSSSPAVMATTPPPSPTATRPASPQPVSSSMRRSPSQQRASSRVSSLRHQEQEHPRWNY